MSICLYIKPLTIPNFRLALPVQMWTTFESSPKMIKRDQDGTPDIPAAAAYPAFSYTVAPSAQAPEGADPTKVAAHAHQATTVDYGALSNLGTTTAALPSLNPPQNSVAEVHQATSAPTFTHSLGRQSYLSVFLYACVCMCVAAEHTVLRAVCVTAVSDSVGHKLQICHKLQVCHKLQMCHKLKLQNPMALSLTCCQFF